MNYLNQLFRIDFSRLVGLFGLFVLLSIQARSQNIGINTDGSDPDPSAILDVKSTDKGLLIPRMNSAQRLGIPSPAEGLMVYDLSNDNYWFFNGSQWVNQGNRSIIHDGDADTYIETNPFGTDLDWIEFYLKGTNAMRLISNANNVPRLEMSPNGTSENVLIGQAAGQSLQTPMFPIATRNTAVGKLSGVSMTTANHNTFFGYRTGDGLTTGSFNVFLGADAGRLLTDAINNVFVGSSANLNGDNNVSIGNGAGYLATGNRNVLIGSQTGASINGNNNVLIGYNASNSPSSNTMDYTLIIDSWTGSGPPLVYGRFDSGVFRINGEFQISDPASTGYKLPSAAGSNGAVLTMGSSGNTSWSSLPLDQVDDADADPSNEFQTISKSGNTVTLSDSGGSFTDEVDDADADPNNEIQTVSISGNTLTLSNGGGSVNVPSGADNLGNHFATINLNMNNNQITGMLAPTSASDGANKAYVDAHTDGDSDPNNEIQDLSLSGTTLTLSGDATTVDLSSLSDDGDWVISGNDMYSATSGDIGIGTNAPQNKLDLARSDLGQVALQFSGKSGTMTNGSRSAVWNTGASVDAGSADAWSGVVDAAELSGDGDVWTGGLVGDGEVSDYLDITFTLFLPTPVPASATITGVVISITRASSGINNIIDSEIRLLLNNVPQASNKATTTPWPFSQTLIPYGFPNDLWGAASIPPAVVNGSNLGVRIQYVGDITGALPDQQGFVDQVRASVYFEEITGEVNSVWAVGSLDGDYKVNNSSSLSGTTELKIGQDGVTELQGLRIPTGAATGRVLTSSTDGTATWQLPSGDADSNPNNEIQDLSLSGNSLILSGDATPVDLSGFADDGDWISFGGKLYSSQDQVLIGSAPTVGSQGLGVEGSVGIYADGGNSLNINAHGSLGGVTSVLNLNRGRGTFASPIPAVGGDWLGMITFSGYTTLGYRRGASIRSYASSTGLWSSTSTPADMNFYTCPVGSNSDILRLRIKENGNIGVGSAASNPSTQFHIGGQFRLEDGTQGAGKVLTSDLLGNATWQVLPADGDGDSSNELQDIVAGNGLIGGGTGLTSTLNAVAINGLTTAANDIKLGGTLSESTVISAAAFDLGVNLTGTGEFSIRDGGNPMFTAQSDGVMVFNENSLANQDVRMESNASTHMLFLDAGLNRIGIKEDTPEADLHIKSDGNGTNPQLKLEETVGTDGARLIFTNSVETTNQWTLYGKADDTPVDSKFNIFHSGPGNIIQVIGEGRVGIRQNNPTFTLQLPSTAGLGEARAQSWTTYSDKRIKRDIRTLDYGLDEILQLHPSSYLQLSSVFEDGKLILSEEGAQKTIGFIAQELHRVVPEAAIPPKDENTELWGVDYSRLIPVLTKAIQEQQDQIEALQAEVEALKSQR